nr:sensor histidine kinase [Jiangella mangrovi]
MGLFITSVFIQAEKRAALIDELERARTELAQTEHSRGVLAERERLSHEIHDTLAQGFTSILTLAQAIEVALDRNPGAVRDRLALLEQTARDNLAEARALVSSLAPVGLQDATLPEAIERIAARFADETGLDVAVQVDGTAPVLPANVEVVLLRTAQEALTNVRKHAGARRVTVALRFRPGPAGAATVAVVDDGQGFEPDATTRDRYGLRGMRARVEQVGGLLEIQSTPGAGTTVRATVAVPRG